MATSKVIPTIDEIIASGASSAIGYLGRVKPITKAEGFFGEAGEVLNQISTIVNMISTLMNLANVSLKSVDQTVTTTKEAYVQVVDSFKNNLNIDISSPPVVTFFDTVHARVEVVKKQADVTVDAVQEYIDTANRYIEIVQTAVSALQNLQGIISLIMSYITPAGAWIAEQILDSRGPGSQNTIGDYFEVMSDIYDAFSDVSLVVDATINNFISLGNTVTNMGYEVDTMFDHTTDDNVASAESYTGPIGTAEAPGAPVVDTTVTTIDGLGFLWDPKSDFNGKLMVTIPTKSIVTCSVYVAFLNDANKWKRGSLIETGKFVKTINSGTQYRFQKQGSKYNDGKSVWVVADNKEWFIADPAKKYN